jgi:GR25 family glycosyltransferase involved in LPS biosynthesis
MEKLTKCQFYCLTFNNEDKKNNMVERFDNLDIECKFHSGIEHNDCRILKTLNKSHKKHWSITYGHLNIIHDYFYNSDKKYAIICEDDIKLHVNFNRIMEDIINDFEYLNLDILLLGYLLPYKLAKKHLITNYPLKHPIPENSSFTYHSFPDYLTGTHMYMITKKYAKYLINQYYYNYTNKYNSYFLFDKILCDKGNRALIYPMIAVENDEQEDLYHVLCNKVNNKVNNKSLYK